MKKKICHALVLVDKENAFKQTLPKNQIYKTFLFEMIVSLNAVYADYILCLKYWIVALLAI